MAEGRPEVGIEARGKTLDRGSVIEAVVANGFGAFTRVGVLESSTASLNKSTPRDRHHLEIDANSHLSYMVK